jgi:5,10-methylenetetrahydromethanopterin reductase
MLPRPRAWYRRTVRIGYGAGTGVRSVTDLRDEARWAAAAGFRSFWVSQVFGVDPIVALAAIGTDVPEFEELGTSVVPLAGRHPLALAAQALTAQSALDGRFTLGVGASHQLVTEGFFGEPYQGAFSRTVEFLDALIPLLDGRPADVDGEQVFAKGWLTIEADPCPVLLAALGPRMLELAGRVTAGTSLGSCGPRTIEQHIVPAITASAERRGRPTPRVVALVGVCVTADPDGAREHARTTNQLYDNFPSYRRVLDLEGVAGGADLMLAGTIDTILAGFTAYADAGVTDLRVAISARTDEERLATRAALADAIAQGAL